ncbi:MAG: hypothetical protein M1820_003098 [Bogoriella megaspora]|nr:MAG: hypothetical protein M1820_003098 [Bogoriella megaspora]
MRITKASLVSLAAIGTVQALPISYLPTSRQSDTSVPKAEGYNIKSVDGYTPAALSYLKKNTISEDHLAKALNNPSSAYIE